ncbi:dehalogenase/hydrolase [Rhizobium grahamii CCGE 502]|uniref:Dehalogenase/hydrolase n=1 Tax=Rhizobium grahamii CCGE 502 TaxID=990285 RepID=S3HT09_9HYPH|nr:dehalogenase/hydrolase [Rhizobium grahamii CCGE 502]
MVVAPSLVPKRSGDRVKTNRRDAVSLAPLPPPAELQWWYQFYFATDRGREGYEKYTSDFAKLIWQLASPHWKFDDETFSRSAAAFANPDHVAIVVHNYRWRLGLAPGEDRFDEYEAVLAKVPDVSVPTITLEKATRTGHLIRIQKPTPGSSKEDMNTV